MPARPGPCGRPTPWWRRAAAGSVLILSLLATTPAGATSWAAVSLPSLCRHAEIVVVGRVRHVVALWAHDGHDIYTYVTLVLERSLKGRVERPDAFTIRFRGGRVGSIASVVAGAPRLAEGERVVLFLTAPDAAGFPQVLGLRHGVWRVRSGRVISPSPAGTVGAVAPVRDAAAVAAVPATECGEDLPRFLARVQRLCDALTSPPGKG